MSAVTLISATGWELPGTPWPPELVCLLNPCASALATGGAGLVEQVPAPKPCATDRRVARAIALSWAAKTSRNLPLDRHVASCTPRR